MRKIKWNIVWGVFITFSFLILMFIRLDFFHKNSAPVMAVPVIKSQRPQDSWMNIYQNGKKIGFVHRTLTTLETKSHFNETVFMQINTMGVTQALNILTEVDLNSNLFRFNAYGHVVKNKLILFTGLPGAQEKSEIPLTNIPHISGSIYDAAFRTNLEKDVTHNFSIFDPSILSLRSIKFTKNPD